MALVTATFDRTSASVFISGVANKKIYIYFLHMTNTSTSADLKVDMVSLSPLTYYYGGSTGRHFLPKDGGHWGMGKSEVGIPLFIINEGKDLWFGPTAGRLSGIMTYEIK